MYFNLIFCILIAGCTVI